MFKYPYQTTPISAYVLKDIIAHLQRAMVDGELPLVKTLGGAEVRGLYEVPPYLKAVGPFSHPLQFEHFGKSVWVVDTRPFVRALREGGTKIVSSTEYQFAVVRALLAKTWAEGAVTDQSTLGELSARVFTRWVTEGIVRRLGLSALDQQTIAAVAGYYWFGLFEDGTELDETQRTKIAGRTARATFITVEKAMELTGQLGKLNSVSDFCEALRTAVQSSRLEKFSVGLLYAIVGGSWFGAASREVVAVSLEHPPTFNAMLYMALTDRSYHKAQLSRLVEQVNQRNMGKDFANNLATYLESNSDD